MKLISCYTKSHKVFVDEWLSPSLQDDFELELKSLDCEGGAFFQNGWVESIQAKSDVIIQAIKDNWGEVIVYMDVDVQFFGPVKGYFQEVIKNKDIVLQQDDPTGNFCSGLFVVRCNEKTLKLWEGVRQAIEADNRDQLALNRLIRETEGISYGYFDSKNIFGGGTFLGQHWESGARLHVPRVPLIHHANWSIGVEEKIAQLKYVKKLLINRTAIKNKTMQPTISVITPVFNGEKYIEECILNVLDQDCPEAEHIIVDGGSHDRTKEIVKSYADEYSHITWISEKDNGQSHAMNKGIAIAQGKIISFLNADDFYEAGALNYVMELLTGMNDPVFIVGNCKVWNTRGEFDYMNKPKHLKFEELLLGFDLVPHPVNPSAYFYSKQIHNEVGLYNENNHYTMDLEFIFEVVQKYKLRYIDKVLGNYRCAEDTKTYTDMDVGKNDLRNKETRHQVLSKLSNRQRSKVHFNRFRFKVYKANRYYYQRLSHYLGSPHEIARFVKRKFKKNSEMSKIS